MFGGKEPTVIFNGLAQLISLIIPVLVLFELIRWDEKQIVGVMAAINFGASFLATLFTRAQVVPIETSNALVSTATTMEPHTSIKAVVDKAKNTGAI
jgi:hypothetical protein